MTATLIDLAETPDFDLGGLRVCPGRRQVGSNDKQCELEPKVALVLVALASARPNVVSRDRLIERCWDGRIVGDDALNRCIVALRHLAKEFSPPPFAIETVPRVGYSLIEGDNGYAGVGRSWRKLMLALVLLAAVLVAVLVVAVPRLVGGDPAPASMAVLPFRNLSSGDPYFAEGVGEEIIARLTREPQFRIAGNTSSKELAEEKDVRAAAGRLGVDYILEGSVRRQGDQVRVNAGLLRVRDGVRLWSDSFDGKLDDMLAIQSSIGQAIANGLSRKLINPVPGAGRPVDGEAYSLYLNARGLLRSGLPDGGTDAIAMLKRAIALEPGFAPAWSSLAEAWLLQGDTKDSEGLIAIIPQARNAARRALEIDPGNGPAHAIFAELLGSDTPEGIAARLRASQLAAHTAEGQLWRSWALEATGQWAEAYAASRRASEIDPSWSRSWRVIVDQRALMADRRGAEAAINRGFADDAQLQSFALARVAWFNGDFSDAAKHWSDLVKGQSRWAGPAKLSLENALYSLKLSNVSPSRPPRPTIGQARSTPARIWMTNAPSPSEWRKRNRSSAAELVYRDENVIAAKLMLSAGRARELAATYDSPTGLLGLRRGQKVGTCYLQSAAIIAAALRGVGRNAGAQAILRQADATIGAAYRRGPVPLWFDDDAAGIWALQGKPDQAVKALDRALRRGSAHATRTDLARLADEPALRSLAGNAGFVAVQARYDAHLARERQETARALNIAL